MEELEHKIMTKKRFTAAVEACVSKNTHIINYNIEFKTSQKRKTQKIRGRLQQRLPLSYPRT